MGLLLGIDFGTSYFKVGLFDQTGSLKGLGRVAVEAEVPIPGRSELRVEHFWQRLGLALAEALAQAGPRAGEISGISYSSQANTFVLLDRQNAPLTPFVLWTDARAEPVEKSLEEFAQTSEFVRRIGSAGLSAQRAVAKWRWFQNHEPAWWAQAKSVMTLSDYFTFSLTGERAGDAGTAAFLGIYDLTANAWWPEALRTFGLEADALSRPLRPGTVCGHTRAEAVPLLGLPVGIPFAVGSLDHHVAALGSGLGRIADVSISTGTVLAAMTIVDQVIPQAGCYHGPHFDGKGFFRLSFDPRGARQLEVYQRKFAPAHSVAALIELAAEMPAAQSPVTSSSPELGDRDHGGRVRTLLEEIAVIHRQLVRQVTGARAPRKIVATGGGARSALWMQIKADVLGVPMATGASPEPACLGAAMLAAVAAGFYRDPQEAAQAMFRTGSEYLPAAKSCR